MEITYQASCLSNKIITEVIKTLNEIHLYQLHGESYMYDGIN
jgi:hypothetical protein